MLFCYSFLININEKTAANSYTFLKKNISFNNIFSTDILKDVISMMVYFSNYANPLYSTSDLH